MYTHIDENPKLDMWGFSLNNSNSPFRVHFISSAPLSSPRKAKCETNDDCFAEVT